MLVPPTQNLVFVGAEALSLPYFKLTYLKVLIASFCSPTWAAKKQLQQLTGKLNLACEVVYSGSTFLRSALDCMNSPTHPTSRCRLTT